MYERNSFRIGTGEIRSSFNTTYVRPFVNGPGLVQKTAIEHRGFRLSNLLIRTYLVDIEVVVWVTIVRTGRLIYPDDYFPCDIQENIDILRLCRV